MIKLIPIAKPVRFTIKSGGRDCADLEGLRKSFNVDDLNKIEIKQLQEWAKRKCSDVPSIAERLNKRPTELEYYQIFFQQDFKDLHTAWLWLKESSEFDQSAKTLCYKLISESDKQTISDLLSGRGTDKFIELILSGDIDTNTVNFKVALRNNSFLCKKLISSFQKKDELSTNERNLLTFLASIGLDEAENIIARRDYEDFEKRFIGISDEELMVKVAATKNDDINKHKQFFTTMAQDIISHKPKTEEPKFTILKNLAYHEIDVARDYVEKNSSFSKEEFSRMLLYLLDYKGDDYEFDLKKEFGSSKVESLPYNLKNFATAVSYCNPIIHNGNNYGKAIEFLSKDLMSDERLFFRFLLEGKKGKLNQRHNDREALKNHNYVFFMVYKNQIYPEDWKMLPDDFKEFHDKEWNFCHAESEMSPSSFKKLLRIYFKHFLEDKYYHGELEDL